MATLLVTSIMISKSVFALLPNPDSIYLRDVHWFAAYWVMIIVGVHLGLHWMRVMAMVRTALRLTPGSPALALTLRVAAAFLVSFGLWNCSVLGLGAKLTFTYSLDFWDFNASVASFFGQWAGIVCLPAIVTHYIMVCWLGRRTATVAGRQARVVSSAASEDAARASMCARPSDGPDSPPRWRCASTTATKAGEACRRDGY